MAKTGRNAPCPCGSGKKFKKCCMMKKQTESLTRSMIHRKADELLQSTMAYFEENFDKELIADAWGEFYGLDGDFEGNPYTDMFFRWFLFYWLLDEDFDILKETIYPSPETIGARFLKENKDKMDSLSIRVLEATLSDPLSFWQVIAVEPDKGLLLKDLILGRERFVEELSGSQQLKKWDILLANMQELDGIFVLNITGPYMLPSSIIETIKEEFYIDSEENAINQLFDLDLDLIDFYQEIIEEMFTASEPEFRNMDGKELIFTKSTYVIEATKRQEIIDSIMAIEDVFENVGLDSSNNESFLWVGVPENISQMKKVIKGHVKIAPDRLVTECNSSERDNQLRRLLQELLGDSIRHQKTESNPIETMNSSEMSGNGKGEPLNLDELPDDVRDQLIENLESMYMKWADQPIPVLNNLTPREAVKNPEGKTQVINLVNDWENKTAHMGDKQFDFNFNKLREDLGLPLE